MNTKTSRLIVIRRPFTPTVTRASVVLFKGTAAPVGGSNSVTIKFKRDRKIRNKAELTRLQRQFEAGVAEIESMERSKEAGAVCRSLYSITEKPNKSL